MIYINGKFLTQKMTGVQRVAYELTKRLISLDDRIFVVVPNGKLRYEYEIPSERIKRMGLSKGVLWEQIELPIFLGKDLLINLGNVAPLFHKRNVVMIHDVIWLRYPESYSKAFVKFYTFLIPRLVKRAMKILVVSKTSMEDLVNYFSVPEEKISVVYPGISEKFTFKNLKRENFILWVGTNRKHKNVENLLKAFYIVLNNLREDFKLLLVGLTEKDLLKDYGADYERVKGKVILKEFVSDEELVNLYNRAYVFAFPSLYEGFGLPPLEAMACGCPTVVSNRGSLPEVCGDASFYVNPESPESIAEGIISVIKEEDLRESLISRGFERAKFFNWNKSTEEVYNLIRDLL